MTRLSALCTMALTLTLLTGCAAGEIRSKFATQTGCQSEATVDNIGANLDIVQGCGKTDVFGRAMSTGRWSSVSTRASFDLSCEELTVKHLADRSVGVTGCGRKAVFVHDLMSGWVLNSDSKPAADGAEE